MKTDVVEFCRTCGICQQTKPNNQKSAGTAKMLPGPRRSFESVGMDFMGPLVESHGFDYLLVVICRLLSMVRLIPTNRTVTASGVAQLFMDNIIVHFGTPDSIMSDRDARFTSKFWKELNRITGTKLLMSTAYHPQTDGATERVNRTITQILRAMVSKDHRDWTRKLSLVEFAINSSINASTGFAPFELVYGHVPRLGGFKVPQDTYPGVKNYLLMARWNLIQAHDNIIESRVKAAIRTNLHRRDVSNAYKLGDLVYLSTENLPTPKDRSRKLMPKFIGPFAITKVDDDSPNVTLRLPPEMSRIHPKFHVKFIRPYHANDESLFPNRNLQSVIPWNTENGPPEQWEVDEIIGHKWHRNKLWFHILWTLGDDTWEEQQNCKDLAALDEYLELMGVTNVRRLPK